MSRLKAVILLSLLFVIAIVLRTIAAVDNQIYVDGCGYIMHAWSIAQGRLTTPYWMAGIDHYYPPLYPFFIYLFHFLTGSYPVASKAVSVFFSGLLMISVYHLGKRMFSREVGLFAGAVLVCHPLLFEVGCNAYSEPLFLFLLSLSMLLAWRMIDEKKGYLPFLAGLCLGLGYLTRPQAIASLACLILIIIWLWLFLKRLSFVYFLKFLILALLGFYILALPYDFYRYKKEGIWSPRFRMEFFKKGYQFGKQLEWFVRERTLNKEATELIDFELSHDKSIVTFIKENPGTYIKWALKDLKYIFRKDFLFSQISTPIFCFFLVFLFIGLISIREPQLKNFKAHFYLFLWFFSLLLIVPFSTSMFDRYFLPLVLSLAIWTGCGADFLKNILFKSAPLNTVRLKINTSDLWIGFILLILIYPNYNVRQILHEKTAYPEEDETLWIKNVTEGAQRKIILSSEPLTALYSGNYWYMLPVDNVNRTSIYAKAQGADYLLADLNFYNWLKAPIDYQEVLLSPFSKYGLEYLGSFWIGKDKLINSKAIYKVEPLQSYMPDPPNIILISIDTLRADHLSCYGYNRKTSPYFDKIADQGIRFETVISQSPKTAPSHMTIFTSLYPEIHEVRQIKYGDDSMGFSKLSPDWTTLTEILKSYGYRTAAYTGGGQVSGSFGFERGFEIYEKNMLRVNGRSFDPVFKWISHLNPDEHFFLFLHTYQVHSPYCPPAPYNKLYDPDYKGWIIDDWNKIKEIAKSDKFRFQQNAFWGGIEKGVNVDGIKLSLISGRDAKHMEALYDGEIRYTDEMFGRFFRELQKQGVLGNKKTLLIITSDHGEEFREHGDFLHKRLYRETLEVPLIFYWPGVLESGKVIKGQVRLIDLAPTILELAGIQPPAQMQGVSLKSALVDSIEKVTLSAYSADPFIHFQRSLRSESWMYYINEGEKKEELYMKSNDYNEQINLLNVTPQSSNYNFIREQAQFLHNSMVNFNYYNLKHRVISAKIEPEKEISEIKVERIDEFRALGYIK